MTEKTQNDSSSNKNSGKFQMSSVDAEGKVTYTEVEGVEMKPEEIAKKEPNPAIGIKTQRFHDLTPEQIELAVKMMSQGIMDSKTLGLAMKNIDPPKETLKIEKQVTR